MVKVKRNNRLKMGTEARIRHVKLLRLKKKYRYMTGGSKRKFLISFALGQLKAYGKNGLRSKLPLKPGTRWTITYIGQKTDSLPEDDVIEGISEESESDDESDEEDEEDYSDSNGSYYETSSCGDTDDDSSSWIPPQDRTFSFGLRNENSDDSDPAAMPSAQCSLDTQKLTLETLQSLGLRNFFEKIEEHVSSCHCFNRAQLKDLVLCGPLDGTTPLVLACHHGDLEMVMYLVEKWGVCVNDTAVYYPKGNFKRSYKSRSWKIQGATPVFVASYNRKFSIVEYLIGKGADVNLKTTSRRTSLCYMTPLVGAIRQYFSSRFDYMGPKDLETIVIPLVRLLLENGARPPTLQDGYPIWEGLALHSVNLTTLLVHHGMALDQKNFSESMAVLHYWANLDKMKSEEDSLTVVKLCVEKGANLMIRNDEDNTAFLIAVESSNWTVVDFLVENDRLDRSEKINGLEMAAALILMESSEYDSDVERALGYFRRAFLLREEEPDPIVKSPLTLESGRTIEWTTLAQVEAGIQNPSEYQIQSYLALLRICPGRFSSLNHCFLDLLVQRRFDNIHDVLRATLDTSHSACEIIDVIVHLVSLMSQLENTHHLFTVKTFKKPLECLLATELGWASYSKTIPLKLFACLARNAKFLIDEDIKESLRRLVAKENSFNRERKEPTMLHEACLHPDDLSAIRLLLLSGANPNASDRDGYGPLHILAVHYRRNWVVDAEVVGNAAQLLLNYGADLCKVNKKRETAADVWKRVNGGLNDLPEWLQDEKVKKLKCQCAKVITSQNIPYEEDELPANLHLLVEAHRHPS